MQPHPNQPHKSMYNNTIARTRKDSQGQRRNCRDDSERRESGASYSQGNAHRGARRRVPTAPVTKPWQPDSAARQFRLARIKEHARGPSNSKESTSPRCSGQHSGCRRPVLPCRLPLRQPSLLLQLGWPPVRLVRLVLLGEAILLCEPQKNWPK